MRLFAALWIEWSVYAGIFYFLTDRRNPEGRFLRLWAKSIFVVCVGLVLALVAFAIRNIFGYSAMLTTAIVFGLLVFDKVIFKLELLAFPADFLASRLCLMLEHVLGPARRA